MPNPKSANIFPIPFLYTSAALPNEKPPPKKEQHIVMKITVFPYFTLDTAKSSIVFNFLEDTKPIKSIINNLSSQKFTRLKIGISHNKNIDTKDYVLGKFKDDDWKVLTDSYNKVLDIVENFISKDVNTLKQIYSNKNN